MFRENTKKAFSFPYGNTQSCFLLGSSVVICIKGVILIIQIVVDKLKEANE